MNRAQRIEPRRNWVGGAWREAGDHFDVSGPEVPAEVLAKWPRTSAGEAAEAVEAARSAEAAWRALPGAERTERLARFARRLEEDRSASRRIARRLDLDPEGLHAVHAPRGLVARARASVELAPLGTTLWRPHWSELVEGAARGLLSILGRGDSAVWVVDPRLPEVGEVVALAAEEADLSPGPVGLLHDDGETALRGALATGSVARLEGAGPADEVAHLTDVAARGPSRALGANARGLVFGAGVVEPRRVTVDLRVLRRGTFVVRDGDDPRAQAERILVDALGRVEALGGQRPGQSGRVVCHVNRFSELTEELLVLLEGEADGGRRPWAPSAVLTGLDPRLPDVLRRSRELGLDEGATLIHEGGRDSGSRSARAKANLVPMIFTNVEETMRLARLDRPLPLLVLVRASSDEAADGIARRLDRPAPPEGSPTED